MERLRPTESHVLWGGAVEVHCFGTRHGNWSLAGKTPGDAEKNNPGVLDRMARLGRQFEIGMIWAPNPSTFNGGIVDHDDDAWRAWRHNLRRGPLADGVRLDVGTAFAVSSGDCPTVILRDSHRKDVIAAHAGRDSLLKADPDDALIWSMMRRLDEGAFALDKHAFIACGIGPTNFTHDVDDTEHGPRNRELQARAAQYAGAACIGDLEGRISLRHLITGQLIEHGVPEECIGADGTDTYEDRDDEGKPLWHSHRRDKDGRRNLVLVIRRT